ncbi:UNVERIFIED_CONTAM: hypothetical protein Sindi_0399200 [Sesamum indicum]
MLVIVGTEEKPLSDSPHFLEIQETLVLTFGHRLSHEAYRLDMSRHRIRLLTKFTYVHVLPPSCVNQYPNPWRNLFIRLLKVFSFPKVFNPVFKVHASHIIFDQAPFIGD